MKKNCTSSKYYKNVVEKLFYYYIPTYTLYIPNVIIVSYQQLGLLFWMKKHFDDFFFRYTNIIIILSLSFQIMILLPAPTTEN